MVGGGAKIINAGKRQRILLAMLFLLVVFRVGSYIPTPGVDVKAIIGAVLDMADLFK